VVVSQNRNNGNASEPNENWVQAPGALVEVPGYHSRENFEIVYAKSCNLTHFCVLKHFNNGNGVPHVFPLEMTPEHCRQTLSSRTSIPTLFRSGSRTPAHTAYTVYWIRCGTTAKIINKRIKTCPTILNFWSHLNAHQKALAIYELVLNILCVSQFVILCDAVVGIK